MPDLKKALAQHHLVSGALCRPILEFLVPRGKRVLEIGPGGGVLTAELLAAGARVVGCELDLAWAALLRRRLPDPRLALVVADALAMEWSRLIPPTLVAGNLPYNVATAIIERVLPHHRQVPRAAFLVQREVAERLVAKPGDPAYGSLSVIVAAWSESRILGRVKPGSFRPPPKVESAFVGFVLREPPLPAAEMAKLVSLVRLAFAQRRKTLRNALASQWGREEAAAVLAGMGLGEKARAEELGLEQFLALYQAAEACSAASSLTISPTTALASPKSMKVRSAV
jgi:16S rRNA (adenine1518-N6/adenine1519-N6)-dimethyltransferase